MKDLVFAFVFVMLIVVTLVASHVSGLYMGRSGFYMDKILEQKKDLDKIHRQIDFVCGTYRDFVTSLEGKVKKEEARLYELRHKKQRKRKGKKK